MARVGLNDIEQAELAAHNGGSEAFYNLGLLYSTGKGVEMNYIIAHKWFNLATMRGNELAREYRANLACDMSADEVSQAQRLARKWIVTH